MPDSEMWFDVDSSWTPKGYHESSHDKPKDKWLIMY